MDINQIDYELQKQKSNITLLQECLKNINNYIQNIGFSEDVHDITEFLRQVKENLDNCKNNVNSLVFLKEQYYKFKSGSLSTSESNAYNQLLDQYTESNRLTSSALNDFLIKYLQNAFFNVDNVNQTIIKNKIEENCSTNFQAPKISGTSKHIEAHKEPEKPSVHETPNVYESFRIHDSSSMFETSDELKDNNVLLISEKKNKIFLPYTINDLNEILESNRHYHSIQEIIKKEYIVPLDRHKNGIISRFKETFNFMRKKEKASLMDSLDFALDLAFNYKLNPAIILACKDLEQLDTYLDCLELNELNKFDYFKIEYEISPTKR